MMTSKASRRPAIHMIDTEADIIADLAMGVEERLPQVSRLLLREVTRAKVHKADRVPANLITMHATVQFADQANGKSYSCQLVYPGEADISGGRISILTPVGAGLIGLREGQSILWPDRDGHERTLTILKVTPACTPA
ncbi:nucleoside diphosphate kinase regulator [Sphingomonas sp. DBB INV C78]|uniref:nucleoside diphosphate kinase regulator n=1 Tax=Sphingomonas sp. DBB INV C78 TaxID=3349434 RepID=UPI0036D39403